MASFDAVSDICSVGPGTEGEAAAMRLKEIFGATDEAGRGVENKHSTAVQSTECCRASV